MTVVDFGLVTPQVRPTILQPENLSRHIWRDMRPVRRLRDLSLVAREVDGVVCVSDRALIQAALNTVVRRFLAAL